MRHLFSLLSKFWLVSVLGFLSGLPMSLFGTTLQAWFTSVNHHVIMVGSLSLLQFPFLIRFIWGPLVDRFYLKSLGRRKTWLILCQGLLFLVIELLSHFNPSQSPFLVLGVALFIAIFSSIQDVVIDAHRIESIDPAYYGFAAVTYVYAYRLAMLISGGLSLIFAQKYGFEITYQLLALFFLAGLVIVYFSKEPELPNNTLNLKQSKPYWDMFKKPWCGWLVGLIFTLKIGEVFVSNSSPMMVPFMLNGLGLSLSKIAYVNKILGLFAQLSGGLLAAFLMMRFSLMRLLLYLGAFQCLSNLGFWILSLHPGDDYLLWSMVLTENLASGMTSTVLVALLMKMVDTRYTASQFSFWMIFVILPRLIAGPLGGYIVFHYNWATLFQMSSLATALYIIFWYKIKQMMRAEHSSEALVPIFKVPG